MSSTFTGRERIQIAAGLCGWLVQSPSPQEDILWHSLYRWIQIRYDTMNRIRSAVSHSQIGEGGPILEQGLEPGPDRAEQIIGWVSRFV